MLGKIAKGRAEAFFEGQSQIHPRIPLHGQAGLLSFYPKVNGVEGCIHFAGLDPVLQQLIGRLLP